ncbi:ABC transporter permease, partial [Klebsiella pneumoniae]
MKKALKVLSIVLLLLYLFIPLIATFLFSICSDWSYS